jgi:hypothetical protein
MQQRSLRRWPQIRAGIKNVFNLARERRYASAQESRHGVCKARPHHEEVEARDTMKKEVMYISDSRMTCKECGDVGHSGVNCPEFQEDVNYISNKNNYRP